MMTGEMPSATFMSALRQVLGTADSLIPLHEPEFCGKEWELVKDCLDTGWVSSVGKYVDEFEVRLAEYTGAKHAVAVVNGTSALHAALRCLGVGVGDEVLVPALTFVATANAVCQCGATPHFVDSAKDTLGIDPDALERHLDRIAEPAGNGFRNRETGKRLAALIPMHTFGHPASMDELLAVARRFNLLVIEDAAESLGSYVGDKHTGTFGHIGVLSFNGNKIITTGGGGAILTNDSGIARHAKHLTTTAKRAHPWEFFHDEAAFNYRLPNINAALGCAQLDRLPDLLKRKRIIAEAYQAAFAKSGEFEFVKEPEGCSSNYWLNTVRLVNPVKELRDELLLVANQAGYQCRPVWTLMHRLPMYVANPRAALSMAEQLECALINIPSSPILVSRLHQNSKLAGNPATTFPKSGA